MPRAQSLYEMSQPRFKFSHSFCIICALSHVILHLQYKNDLDIHLYDYIYNYNDGYGYFWQILSCHLKLFIFLSISPTVSEAFKGTILVSQGCYNKLSQTRRLKIEIYSLTILEARNIKSRYEQGHISSEGSRKESFLASWLLVTGNPWHCLACSCITPISACIFICCLPSASLSLSKTLLAYENTVQGPP